MALTKATYSMIQGACSNAWDFLTPTQIADVQAGTLGEDVTTELQAWITSLGTGYFAGGSTTGARVGYLPPGKYKISSTLNIPAYTEIFGVPLQSAIYPAASMIAGSAVMTLNSGCALRGIVLDGTNATDLNGFVFGQTDASICSFTNMQECTAVNFSNTSGTTGIACWLRRTVGCTFYKCNFSTSFRGLFSDHPTESEWNTLASFYDCIFRENKIGVYLKTAHGQTFTSCDFEGNEEEGAYLNSGACERINFQSCWFENNWTSLTGDPARQTKYNLYVVASPYVTCRDTLFNLDANGTRSVAFAETAAPSFCLDNNVYNYFVYDQIFAYTGSSGEILNWPVDRSKSLYLDFQDDVSVKVDGEAERQTDVAIRSSGDLSVVYTTKWLDIITRQYTTTYNVSLVCVPTFTTASGDIQLDVSTNGVMPADALCVGSMVFSGINKAGYTEYAPVMENGSNNMKIMAYGVGKTPAYVTFADITSGATLKMYITLTTRTGT